MHGLLELLAATVLAFTFICLFALFIQALLVFTYKFVPEILRFRSTPVIEQLSTQDRRALWLTIPFVSGALGSVIALVLQTTSDDEPLSVALRAFDLVYYTALALLAIAFIVCIALMRRELKKHS